MGEKFREFHTGSAPPEFSPSDLRVQVSVSWFLCLRPPPRELRRGAIFLVDEIRSLLRGFGDFSVRPVRRTANEAAHRLAKEGCENKMCNTWFGDPPECIVNSLVLDALVIE